MTEKNYDLIIIGSGPGGYVAGIRAAQLGLSVAIIEKDKAGGVCLNIGCIPSKSLIHQATLVRSTEALSRMGVGIDLSGLQYQYVREQSRSAAEKLSKGVHYLLKKNKVEFIQAEATITSKKTIRLSTNTNGELTAKNIIIATGARPKVIPGFPVDEKDILSSTGALLLTELPGSMMILGGGAIGIEFAYIFQSFGVKVHVVEMMERILPLEDDEVAVHLGKQLKKQGIDIRTSTKAVSYDRRNGSFTIQLENAGGKKDSINVDKMLIAVGRSPDISLLDTNPLSIKTEGGCISINDYYETSVPRIYAIGDVINSPQLAHVASKEGEIAVEHIAGLLPEKRINPDLIPRAVYSEPQAAGFGPTEVQLRERNISYKKVIFPYKGAGKATALENTEGFVKILFSPDTKEILGAFIIGSEASELIHEILLAKKAELLPEDVAGMIHAHPTLSEITMEVMRGVDGRMIHI
ncbi:MAG: dihydrolipoyl dehydrogenase [Spirochaetales bacterium]|nr:dihydrolipoyl dehydrogenase [Spirochaetales bacterium]